MSMDNRSKSIDDLILDLHSESSMDRSKAREELVKMGSAAIPQLMDTFNKSKSREGRKEALLALRDIDDPVAIPFYVEAIQDKTHDIRWIGAQAIAWAGTDALKMALKTLVEEPDNYSLRQGMHFVIKLMKENGKYEDPHNLLDALDNEEIVTDHIQIAAENSLQDLTV